MNPNNNSGIYSIECLANGVVYVGQSSNIKQRWARHRSLLMATTPHTNRRLHRSARKYGLHTFAFTVLENCDHERLTELEQYWVDEMRLRHGALVCNAIGPVDNPVRGTTMSAERRRLLSWIKTGVPVPALRGDANPSRRPEFRARMTGDANPAKRPSVRRRMSERSGAARAVRASDGRTWRTMSACAADLGVSVAAVHAAATKKNPTVSGLVMERIT